MRGPNDWFPHHLFSLAALAMKDNMDDVAAILCEAAVAAASYVNKPDKGLSKNVSRKANQQ